MSRVHPFFRNPGIRLTLLHLMPVPDHASQQYIAEPLASSGNWTEPEGGIFAKYQVRFTRLYTQIIRCHLCARKTDTFSH